MVPPKAGCFSFPDVLASDNLARPVCAMMSPHLAMRQRLRSGEREIILLVEEEGESYVFEFNADIGL